MKTNIKNIRQSLCMSQGQVAASLNITRSAVELIEKGHKKLTPDQVKRLCKLFNVSESQLIV